MGKNGLGLLSQIREKLISLLTLATQTVGYSNQNLKAKRLNLKLIQAFALLFGAGLSLSLMFSACSSNPASNASLSQETQQADIKINLVSFSVTQAAHEKIIPKFIDKWKKEHHQTIKFETSYGGSGSQTLAVIEGGQAADIVHLSLPPDVQKLEQVGLIQPGWEQEFPNDSVVSRSVVAIVTRAENPKGITNWANLAKDGVRVVTPNPQTSGGARWNFLALWNAALKSGGNETKALEFVTKVYQNAPILPETAREATEAFFKAEQGDALLTYENEVILKRLNGQNLPYVIPEINFSIDNPVAIVDKNVDKHGTRQVAQAFIEYLYTPEAQQEFAQTGYRPIDANAIQEKALKNQFATVKTLAKAKDYGNWTNIQKKFFNQGAIFDTILRDRKL